MFEQPDGDHSEGEEEGVEEQGETGQLVQLQLLLIKTDVWWYSYSTVLIHSNTDSLCLLIFSEMISLIYNYDH